MYPYEKQIKDHHEIQPDHPIVDKRIGKYYPQHTVLIMLHATSKAAKVYIMPSFLHGGIDHYFHSMKHFTGASIGFCPIWVEYKYPNRNTSNFRLNHFIISTDSCQPCPASLIRRNDNKRSRNFQLDELPSIEIHRYVSKVHWLACSHRVQKALWSTQRESLVIIHATINCPVIYEWAKRFSSIWFHKNRNDSPRRKCFPLPEK